MKCLVFLLLLPACLAHLNVYLSSAEVWRLLGLTAELFYVRDGQINSYALNFVVPVPATISELHFTWQSLARRPLPYTLHVDVASEPEAMHPPTFNISSTGYVPTETQTWRIDLPCMGTVAAEVNITISLNISTGSSSTILNFRRRKICLKEAPRPAVRVDSVPHAPTSADIFYAGAGCAGGVLLIAAVAAVACKARARKLRRARSDEQDAHAFLPDSSCKSAASYTSYRRPTSLPAVAAEERARDLQQRIAELTIQRCRVRLRAVAMEGTFGRVYKGTYADEEGREQEVLVKTVAEHASQVQVSLLLQEGCMLYGLHHEKVLSVLGVSIEDQTAPFLLYPWNSGWRNLKQFLLACRGVGVGGAGGAPPPPPLTTQHVVRMALHALDGLAYLHSQHVLHKDIAARNCIVDENLRVMIADNALSRDLFPADYHCLGDNENRPIKWLALESLSRRQFSPAADVWALGVLLWELTTLAHQPYAEVDPFEVAAYLRDGYRLQQPANCPDELFAVMAYCWAMSPDDRPTLPQLQTFLRDFHTQLTRFV
ncbi:PREDICTED: tyrosine-protein kinase Dnt [Papilio xuthus]|uniref:receptor protein-tyrosine kinase n=1 Tax=Papilio xuthus TaxID=66420 RepID=A0AAJ6ZQE1_PAPXU|nr:PREDICTED: tyrosine-protein kinase Dnt [Papilio xuthus]